MDTFQEGCERFWHESKYQPVRQGIFRYRAQHQRYIPLKSFNTSFLPDAGKSALILDLAASMALKKSKVLLVDLDLRKGTLGSALKISHSGISSYLSGRTDNDYLSLCDEIAPNLKMLPVGTLPPNSAELLLKDRFKVWLEDVRTRFDYVFVDCPPIEVVADAGIVSRNVDMTVFVLRTGQLDKSILPVLDSFYKNDQYKYMGVVLYDVRKNTAITVMAMSTEKRNGNEKDGQIIRRI